MKIRETIALLTCSILLPFLGMTQCGTIHTLSYDTTVNGIGGTDNPYDLSFPKFNGGMGTLLDVKIISVLTVNYQYDIENSLNVAKIHKLRINRSDEISSSALAADIINDYSVPASPGWMLHSLSASDGVPGSGDDFDAIPPFALVDHDTIINQSAAAPVNFLGSGNITFNYSSSMSRTSNPSSGADITNSVATDEVKFILQYVYCDNILLASDITSFSASKKEDYINILWLTSNEVPNHSYELQKSYDGVHFVTVTTVSSNPGINQTGSYAYNYVPLSEEKGKIYFRIKQTENSTTRYSPLRVVDLGDTAVKKIGLRLIPNPSNGVFSIMLTNNTVASDWNIELFNIKGQVISKKIAMNSTLSRFPMRETLSSGAYFVLVTNKKNSQKFVERMIVN
jgi:hypothetical protein